MLTDEVETLRLCSEHIKSLRSNSCLASANIILIPENNLGNEAQYVADKLIKRPNLTILCEGDIAYGVNTSRGMIERYAHRAMHKFGENAVVYHDGVMSGNPYLHNKTPKQREQVSRNEFERQLRCFRKIFALPKSLTSSVRVAHSGLADKDGQRSGSLRDDMCMAFLFGIYWAGQHMSNLGPTERGYTRRLRIPMSEEHERPSATSAPKKKRARVNPIQKYTASASQTM